MEWQRVNGWGFFWQFWAFPIFFIAATAEINRTPFDMVEADSEIVAGFATEYSGMRFGFFFFAEYVALFIMSTIVVTLFFGGWLPPFFQLPDGIIGTVLGAIIFFAKTYFFVFVAVWMRATLPRVRVDQLMGMAWKWLLPLALVNLFLTAGHRADLQPAAGGGPSRWPFPGGGIAKGHVGHPQELLDAQGHAPVPRGATADAGTLAWPAGPDLRPVRRAQVRGLLPVRAGLPGRGDRHERLRLAGQPDPLRHAGDLRRAQGPERLAARRPAGAAGCATRCAGTRRSTSHGWPA